MRFSISQKTLGKYGDRKPKAYGEDGSGTLFRAHRTPDPSSSCKRATSVSKCVRSAFLFAAQLRAHLALAQNTRKRIVLPRSAVLKSKLQCKLLLLGFAVPKPKLQCKIIATAVHSTEDTIWNYFYRGPQY